MIRSGAIVALFLSLSPAAGLLASAAEPGAGAALPAAWQADWAAPPASCRPLQIVHGIPPNRASLEGMAYYKDRGLGGIVCNIAFDKYMVSEEHWKTLVAGVEACQKLGLRVWLYDEHGYPSGGAGGLVLKENPAFEATELAFDVSRPDPFIVRPAYEFTHASNNYHAARRYLNLLDDRGVRCFLEKTHEAYAKRLGPHLGKTIEAFFTDEPSLVAVNIGQIPEDVRKKVPVTDPPDPAVKMLPRVPWVYDMPEQYRKRYNEDLLPKRRSLFEGDAPEDRQVRSRFWGLVADLVADRYHGQIQRWCRPHQVASSGHDLWEEAVLHHVPLYGNGLKPLGLMDIPGLDMLSSDPETAIHEGWLTAALPFSAGVLNGHRRVMTEISDFGEKMGGKGPAPLDAMQAAAAWQAAWGVTEFTLYYSPGDRPPEAYRAYGEYVGRLNAVFREARPAPQVLLYYPVCDLWPEYKPVAEPLKVESQSPRAQRIVKSFKRLGQALQRGQVPFLLADHEMLAAGKAGPDGRLTIRGTSFEAVVLPEDVELPALAAAVVESFRKAGGRVLVDRADARLTAPSIVEGLKPVCRIEPASTRVAAGHFVRDGRRILLVANLAAKEYAGQLDAGAPGAWLALDPATGAVKPAESGEAGRVRLALAPRQAVILVQDRK